jgi:hypothetical protein
MKTAGKSPVCGGSREGERMGVYLPQWWESEDPRTTGSGETIACPWCGEPVDRAAVCVSPPSVLALRFHPQCAAEMGEWLLGDAREAKLAASDREWAARAVALVRYRLDREERGRAGP